jgi:LysM repeat protein
VVEPDRVRFWAARLAAPAAFFVAALVLVWLVQSAISSDSGEETTAPTISVPTTSEPGTTTSSSKPRKKKFYRVRSGDTLESIAARFDTTVETLTLLNPGIDPLALNPGQKIRVA